MSKFKIAIIGDVHGQWNDVDTEYFNSSDYDLILFTGDLRTYKEREENIANRISGLTKKSILIPGNTDTSNLFQTVGEILKNQFLIQEFSKDQDTKIQKLKQSIGGIQLSAYETHLVSKNEISFNLIVLRPFAMGVTLSFAPILKKRYGITSIEDSKERYKQLIDSCSEEQIIFLGHNGPFGLGGDSKSLWSSDFTKEPLDWGDIDYRFAIDYAKSKGKKVLAAIAGHIHHRIKGKKMERDWLKEESDTYYINAAKVPRIFKKEGQIVHHHIQMIIGENGRVSVREMTIG